MRVRRGVIVVAVRWAFGLVTASFVLPMVTGPSGNLTRPLVDQFGAVAALPAVGVLAWTVLVASLLGWGSRAVRPVRQTRARVVSVALVPVAYGMLVIVPRAALLLVPLAWMLVAASFLPTGAPPGDRRVRRRSRSSRSGETDLRNGRSRERTTISQQGAREVVPTREGVPPGNRGDLSS